MTKETKEGVKWAIEKALHAGYDIRKLRGFDDEVHYLRTGEDRHYSEDMYTPEFGDGMWSYSQIFSDPEFWKFLGYALRWRPIEWEVLPPIGVMPGGPETVPIRAVSGQKMTDGWVYQMHRFITHLIEGKSADSFFTTLKD